MTKRSLIERLFVIGYFVFVGLSDVFAEVDKASKQHQQLIKNLPLYDDPELADYINQVGQKVAKNSDQTNRDYYFYILDDSGINAFTPGNGYVYIYRGLLTLLTSEAQLAGVLAHEIGHVTERHVSRQKRGAMLGNVAAVVASVIVNDSNVGDAINVSNAAALSGYGREMELEADERAAEYLYRSNYDPEAMLETLSILKDHEQFSLQKSQKRGKKGSTYHGVFSTHPRSDKRLREVIAKAGSLPPGEGFQGRDELRVMLNDVVFGENYSGNKPDGYERYTHKGLGITFIYPQDWSRVNKNKDTILKDANKTSQLRISLEKTVDKSQSSQQIFNTKFPDVKNSTLLDEKSSKDMGVTARHQQQRVAVIKVGRNTYTFKGIAKNNQLSDEQDQQLLEIIKSFRRATRKDLPPDTIKTIYYQRLKPGQNFTQLARNKILGTYTEDYLRLMNGYYPKGEPEPGTWIKLVK